MANISTANSPLLPNLIDEVRCVDCAQQARPRFFRKTKRLLEHPIALQPEVGR
jgi:hypothetical protein